MRKCQSLQVRYIISVEKLIYLGHTRFGSTYAVSLVSQFIHDPKVRHLQGVEIVL